MVSSNGIELLPAEQDVSQRRLPLGPGVVVGSHGNTLVTCPISRLAVQVRCTGPVAAVQVVQAFQNSIPETMELTYLFPLPNGAAVSRFRAQVGQRLIEGQIFEKETAKKQFGSPSRSAFLISMFEREHASVFSVSMGVVNPEDNITIEIAYAELVPATLGEFFWRFPFVLSSKLKNGAPLDSGSDAGSSASLSPGLSAGPNLSLSVQMETGGVPPNRLACSQNCTLQKLQTGDLGIELQKQGELQNRDFVLSYRYGVERAPQCILRHTPRHFVLNVVPPFARPPATCPRDLVLLVDVSDNCSHANRSEVVRRLTASLLNSLGPGERFALVGFNDDLAGYKHGDFGSKEEIPTALQWLEQIRPRGRANISVLMTRILGMVQEPARGLGVVLIAAGHVGNEPELYSTMSVNQTPPPFRFFTVGIDSSISVPFLRRVAGWTRGTYSYMASDEQMEPLAERLIEDTRFPLIHDIHLVDQGLGLMTETCYPLYLPGLGGGQPLTVLGLKSGNGGMEVRGKAFSGHPWGEVSQPLACQNPALGFVWAQHKVREMQDELKLINGPRASRLKQIVMDLSQEYRLFNNDSTAYALVEPQAVSASGGPGGSLLPSLTPYEWREEMAPEPSHDGGGRTRLNKRIQLMPASPEEEAADMLSEPPTVKAPLVSAETSGLKPKEQIFSKEPKRDNKPTLPSGPKIKESAKALLVKKDARGMESGKNSKKPMLPRPNSGEKAQMNVPEPQAVAAASGNGKKAMPQRPVISSAQTTSGSLAVVEEVTAPVVEERVVVEPPPVVAPPAVAPPVAAPPVSPPSGGHSVVAPAAHPSGEPASHEAIARELLKANAELRANLMADMRALYQAIGKAAQTGPDQTLLGFLERILRRIQPVIEQSAMLKEVYRVGILCYKAIQAKDPQAMAKTQHWIQKFATLFQ